MTNLHVVRCGIAHGSARLIHTLVAGVLTFSIFALLMMQLGRLEGSLFPVIQDPDIRVTIRNENDGKVNVCWNWSYRKLRKAQPAYVKLLGYSNGQRIIENVVYDIPEVASGDFETSRYCSTFSGFKLNEPLEFRAIASFYTNSMALWRVDENMGAVSGYYASVENEGEK